MGWFGSGKDKRKVKALIVSDSIKEFIGAVAPLVNEAKLKVSPTGITIRAVDPAHVGMIEVTLTSGAFAKLEAEEMELGMDVTKFESVIAVAKPGEMIDIERDTEMNRLVVKIGSLVEVVPLDMAGMADFEVPNLDFPAMVKVKAEEITQMLKTSKKASDNIELSANKESFRLVGYSGSDIDRELTMNITMNRAQLEELKAPNETASTFSLEYFSLMVNSVEKDRILTISLGNDFPVKIEADLAVDENTGPQGSVFFLLSPRIESPTAHLEIEKAKEREEALDYDAAIRIWEELGYTKEAAKAKFLGHLSGYGFHISNDFPLDWSLGEIKEGLGGLLFGPDRGILCIGSPDVNERIFDVLREDAVQFLSVICQVLATRDFCCSVFTEHVS